MRSRVLASLIVCILLAGVLVVDPWLQPEPARAQEPESASAGGAEGSEARPEVESLRTKYSKTYAEGDGFYTAEISTAAIHFKGPDGSWLDIDNELVPCEDSACGWRNSAGPLSVEFATAANDGNMVSVQRGERGVAFGLLNATHSKTPEVQGNSITYKDVFPTVDLRYEVVGSNVKELIVLNEPPKGRTSATFPLNLKGLTAHQKADGEIELLDEEGKVEFTIPRMWMEDSASGPDREPAYSAKVEATLETRGASQFITVTADEQWLADPERVYPVKIDPFLTRDAAYDTYIITTNSDNHSASSELKIGTFDGGTTIRRSLLWFDVSDFEDPNRFIRGAGLRLFNTSSPSCNAAQADVHRISEQWGLHLVNWGNQPSFDATPVASNGVSRGYSGCDPAFVRYPQEEPPLPGGCDVDAPNDPRYTDELTNVVRGWAAGAANHGLLVKAQKEYDNASRKLYKSADNDTHRPDLHITYTNRPRTPHSLEPSDATTVDSSQPTLSAIYDDQDVPTQPNTLKDDWGCVHFEIRPLGGATLATGHSPICRPESALQPAEPDPGCPYSRGSWQVPVSLAAGDYEWRAWNDDEWLDSAPTAWIRLKVPVPPEPLPEESPSPTESPTAPPDPATTPAPPTASSPTHPDPGVWEKKSAPRFSWSVPDNGGAAIDAYSYSFSADPQARPDTDPDTTQACPSGDPGPSCHTEFDVRSGTYYFYVKARNEIGWSDDSSVVQIKVDMEVDKPALLTSTSHVPGVAFQDNTIDIEWTAVQDAHSGVKGYYYAFREECTGSAPCPHGPAADQTPNKQNLGASNTAGVSEELLAGTSDTDPKRYWAHVVTEDNAGNFSLEGGQDRYYGPFLIDEDGLPFSLNPTLDDSLVAQSDENGLEQFYPYRRHALGTANGYVQLRTGNVVVQSSDFNIPAKGLNAVVKHTYNANRSDAGYHDTGAGKGWVLSLSDADAGLDQTVAGVDLNSPILPTAGDVVDMVAAGTGRLVELTDGDGTVHRFIRRGQRGTEWDSPPGVDLTLREDDLDLDDSTDTYRFIRPDGVTYVAQQLECDLLLEGSCAPSLNGNATWHIVEVNDRNGNKLTVDYQHFKDATTLGQARAVRIKHNGEQNPDQPLVKLNYTSTGRLLDISSFPDTLAARTVKFGIDHEGYLANVTDDFGGTDPRTTSFDYRTFSSDPLAPRLLNTVRDGNGNASAFTYEHDPVLDKWRAKTFTDREQHLWTYAYEDLTGKRRRTTARTPLLAATEYTISARNPMSESDQRIAGGNIVEIKTPGTGSTGGSPTVTESFVWKANLLRTKTDGAGHATHMSYDKLGQITSLDQPPTNSKRGDLRSGAHDGRVETTFTYAYPDAALRDCLEPAPPDGTCHAVADLKRWVTASNVTGEQRRVTFDHDDAGNVKTVTEHGALDRVTAFNYYPDSRGLLSSIKDPEDNVTTFGSDTPMGDAGNGPWGYHRSGQPETITDAKLNAKTFTFTAYGLVEEMEDRDGRITRSLYDGRHNLLRLTAPGVRVTTFTYDGNDNVKTETSPNNRTTSFTYDRNDLLDVVIRPGNRTTDTDYNSDGTKKTVTGPAGAVKRFDYYPNQALEWVQEPAGTSELAQTDYRYDSAGRVVETTFPATTAAGKRPKEQVDYTPSGQPDVVRQTSSTGELDRVTKYTYNPHGQVIQVLGPRREYENSGPLAVLNRDYDAFGQLDVQKRLATSDPEKWLIHDYDFDLAGNLKRLDLPGVATDTIYGYDNLNRLQTQNDPFNDGHTTEFVYTNEGEQKQRIDKVNGVAKRSVHTVFNEDGTLRSKISERAGEVLAQCNFAEGEDKSSGYDADGNLLVTRTVSGGNCETGTTIKTENLTWDTRGFMTELRQVIDPLGPEPEAIRRQSFTYRNDGAMLSSAWHRPGGESYETSYKPSLGGLVEKATPWRAAQVADFDYLASGSLESAALGDDVTGSLGYHQDGSVSSLTWSSGSQAVRSHTNIDYSLDGLRISEKVDLARPTTATEFDKSGYGEFNYDLAGRLISWSSPFPLVFDTTAGLLPAIADDRDYARTNYTLDDAGNITKARTVSHQRVNGSDQTVLTQTVTANYPGGRLSDRKVVVDSHVATLADSTTRQGFCYSDLGEERRRVAMSGDGGAPDGCRDEGESRIETSYDPAGHTKKANASDSADVEYAYDADGSVIARTRTNPDGSSNTTYFFYFGLTKRLAEETTPEGRTKVRYFVSSTGQTLAQERYQISGFDAVDDADAGTWTWLLRDPDGNVGTHVKSDGTVTKQGSYDPYGSPDLGGTSGDSNSTLGFQSDHTDDATGNLLLGPRVYDPEIDRFTTADYFVGSGSDMSLGTDPLTGNRYLFAAANPVAFYEDGHEPCPADPCDKYYSGTKKQQRERAAASSPGAFQAADRDSMAVDQPLAQIGLRLSWADIADALRRQRTEAQMIEPSAFWNSPFATWTGWEEAAEGSKRVAEGSAIGICIVGTLGGCAVAGGALLVAETTADTYTSGSFDGRKFAVRSFRTWVLLAGGAAGAAVKGLSPLARYGLNTYLESPGITCLVAGCSP